ncbi:MAG: hypothetical protein JNK64_27115 [Myxococcales bacterium]|nr:hypothetical protein [Myxococcales bacterium]
MRENIAATNNDDQLELSLDKIDNPPETRLAGRGGLDGFITARRASPINVIVDVHGHAELGVVLFGDFAFNVQGINALFTDPHDPSDDGFAEVRLLGCNVANQMLGRAAMQFLKTKLSGIPVWGTGEGIDAHDFQDDGLIPGHGSLVECADLDTIPVASPTDVVSSWRTKFPGAPGWNQSSGRRNLVKTPRTRRDLLPGAHLLQGAGSSGRAALLRNVVLQAPWAITTHGLRLAYRTILVPAHLWSGGPPSLELVRVDVLARGAALRFFPAALAPLAVVVPATWPASHSLAGIIDG